MSSPRQGILAYPLSGQERGWQGQGGEEGISSRGGRLDSTQWNGEKGRVDIGAVRWVQRIRRQKSLALNDSTFDENSVPTSPNVICCIYTEVEQMQLHIVWIWFMILFAHIVWEQGSFHKEVQCLQIFQLWCRIHIYVYVYMCTERRAFLYFQNSKLDENFQSEILFLSVCLPRRT